MVVAIPSTHGRSATLELVVWLAAGAELLSPEGGSCPRIIRICGATDTKSLKH
jgi:hypothetical protein